MTKDELIVELTGRIDQALYQLEELGARTQPVSDRYRLKHKAEGLKMVKDWLRSY